MDQIIDFLKMIWSYCIAMLDYKFIDSASHQVSFGSVLNFLVALVILYLFAENLRRILIKRVLTRFEKLKSYSSTVAAVMKYTILVIGFFIIAQSLGINLSSIYVLFGSLGVGIGIGLQNIAENLISGVIIFFERPLKVGDRVEVDDIVGQIQDIGPRATTVLTNDNISVIVPNSRFVSNLVINWSHNDSKVRFHFPVGVSYKEDPDRVKTVLLEILSNHKDILDHPKPEIWFTNYGDSSLDFEIVVWTETMTNVPKVLKSELYFEIFKKFSEYNIEIPFPQRDLHLKEVPENLTLASKLSMEGSRN
ncbi:mechanosensitive ion channel family protein [Aureibacter tunicatorum]|uniref:Small-conductance mechanosensitive channel n=1 Tax=Aureibacter tunicatorum TaxID=866807 RepID=A0AAE4BTH9_9BACT|nr:mechanosensitive ion channel domain-containing protein [Aureibacter tunicatorum]MDR6239622.1 small-conductance mechanosensitive channel [Aureibacter tunicatorum]BDD04099.1 mechanosensitive ion channel protein MscS [Aureibacter tunicatorum]